MQSSVSLYQPQSVLATSGERFELSAEQWQKNRQQHQLLLRYFALPLQEDAKCLWLAVDNLANLAACETFSFLTGKLIEPVQVDSEQLKTLLQALNPQPLKIEESPLSYQDPQADEFTESSDEPVILLLNGIFEDALKHQASDIHLEPQKNCLKVRLRIDGVLQCRQDISLSMAARLVSRLKLLAKLDISETRLPQDGRFYFKTTFSDILDFRLSTLPTPLGEKAVLRLQKNKPVQLEFHQLGMTSSQQRLFKQILNQPQGLILVTGPTGSGKSISLYTALSYLNQPERHIMTAEDPIEIELEGIIQAQINPAIGLTFSRLLRTFLRQDPDIIMLGEIRDEESAQIALRAAQTGHLVLSTLHTNDAPSALSRLRQLGIHQHEIDSSLLLVIAQRLVRTLCRQCGGQNRGVEKTSFCGCNQGYRGRIGVYQFLLPEITESGYRYRTDFDSLHAAAQEKLMQGITDEREICRVLGGKI